MLGPSFTEALLWWLTLPSFRMTQPTAGLGCVFPRPLFASSRACRMCCLSSLLMAHVALMTCRAVILQCPARSLFKGTGKALRDLFIPYQRPSVAQMACCNPRWAPAVM